MINPIHITYSPIYPSVETHDMHRILTMAVTILLGEAITLLIKLYANLRNTTLIWSVAFITSAGDVNKTLECVTITDSKLSNRVLV